MNSPYLASDVTGPTNSRQSQVVGLTGGPQLVTMPNFYIFDYGQPFTVAAQLSLQCSLGLGSGSGAISQDYSNTATLSGIEVFDSAMSPVAGFTISSDSSTNYGLEGVVPEPSSLSMVLFGLAGAIMYVWRGSIASTMMSVNWKSHLR